jgi:hypothetical protein
VSPAKAAGFSILAAGSLSITVVAIVFTVSRWSQKRSLRVGVLRGVEINTPSWVREPPGVSAVANLEKERHSGNRKRGITDISYAFFSFSFIYLFFIR